MTEIHFSILAFDVNSALQTTWAFLQKGGIFMIPLAITSIIGMMAILFKFLSFSKNRVIPPTLAAQIENYQEYIVADKTELILKQFRHGDSTLARLAAVAMKYRGKAQNEITQAVEASAREETVHLHAGIGILDIVITVAPLLGLLGTASGLVTIFQGLGETTDHLAVAHGIAEALNTTIAGLTIAVPCVIAHGYFIRRIELITARLEFLLSELIQQFQKSDSKV